jgi:hypothetical protein
MPAMIGFRSALIIYHHSAGAWMHTVDLLAKALAEAQRLGFRIRQEWLGGMGGACVLRGQKWLFLDETLSPAEQLDVVLEALRDDPALGRLPVDHELVRLLDVRKAA